MVTAEEQAARVYSNADGSREEAFPFDGWLYFTEYASDEDGGLSMATGVNQDALQDLKQLMPEEG